MEISDLQSGDILSNQEIKKIFLCSTQGGMRRSLKTNTLVLISNHIKSIYDDRWENDVFYYTGMGQEGDQDLNYSQNRTLSASKINKINIHLFEVFKEKEYTYIGKMFLDAQPEDEKQLDVKYKERTVYVFPLKCASNHYRPSKENFDNIDKFRRYKAKKLSDEKLKRIIDTLNPRTSQRQYISKTYGRNFYLVEFIKRLAKGYCQLCSEKAPFITSNNEPYLEAHHIVWLSKGGSDSLENMVALCPNCHRKMHIVNDVTDIENLKLKTIK